MQFNAIFQSIGIIKSNMNKSTGKAETLISA